MPFAAAASTSEYFDRSINTYIPLADQQAFKIAFYNALVLAFLICCAAVAAAVFCLLKAVLKSMLWAVLYGTVLFPIKKRLTTAIEWYLSALKESGTPLLIGIAVAPLTVLDRGAELLWSTVVSKSAMIFLTVYATAAAIAYESNFTHFWTVSSKLYNFLDSIIWLYSCAWVRALAFVYACCFIGYVYLIGADANKVAVRALSVPLWFVVLCTIAQFFGPLRVLVAVTSAVVILLIVLRFINPGELQLDEPEPEPAPRVDRSISAPSPGEPVSPLPSPPTSPPIENDTSSISIEERDLDDPGGNRYIRAIIGACSLLWISKHPSALVLLIILFIYGILKRTGEYLDLQKRATSIACTSVEAFRQKFDVVLKIFFPTTLREFFKLLFYGDRRIVDGLRASAGMLSTIVVMFTLLSGTLVFGGFLIFHIQSEAMHLIALTSNVIHRNLSANEQLHSWFSRAMNANDIDIHDLDSMVQSAYQYGRTWLPTQARSLVRDEDPERGDMLEEQIRSIVDKLYESYEEHKAQGHRFDPQAMVKASRESNGLSHLWNNFQASTDIRALGMDLVAVIQENVGMLVSVLGTVWAILSANLTLLFSVSAALLGVVLSFGIEILNLLIGIIVFLTMLYYLLAFSGNQWKPIEWLNLLTPSLRGGSSSFSRSVETAISNVFILSFKMALFYGLYMWFIHSIFALNCTILPSVLAAILAAVPFLAPYWVCIFGAIELGLVRGEPLAATLFFLSGFAPMMIVDVAFYREVKGSHPYLTGLAVVGGIYWLGLEGAFIGPILLCCMLVLMDQYKNVIAR